MNCGALGMRGVHKGGLVYECKRENTDDQNLPVVLVLQLLWKCAVELRLGGNSRRLTEGGSQGR